MAESQQFVSENGGEEFYQEEEHIEEQVEEPPFEIIYMSDKKIKYINNRYERINEKMYDHTCDVKLKAGESFFKGHRKVLADASDYFDAMFTHEMKEKDEFVIELKELSPAGITAMLDYFYYGTLTVEENIVPNILEAGRFFHVDWIIDVCCDYMIRHLSLYDFCWTLELADRYSLGDIRWEIFKYFGQNLPNFIEKEDFYKDTCFDFMFNFLLEGMYVDLAEFILMQVVMKWVEKAEDARKEHLLPLLRLLRFHIMDLEELEEVPEKLLEFPEIKNEIEDAKMYCLNIPMQCLKTDEKYLSRGSRPTVVFSAFSEEENKVLYKDPYDDNSNLFIERLGPSGLFVDYSTTNQAVLGNFLFVTGGYNEDSMSTNNMYRFDPRDREWTQIATMTQARVSFSMCSSINKIYVIGGVYHDIDGGSEQILKSVEMYDPEENSWKKLPNLPFGCYDSAAAYCNGKLYVTGGISDDGKYDIPMKIMLSLTDGGNRWLKSDESDLPVNDKIADMLYARQGHSISAINNQLFVLGGYTCMDEGSASLRNCYACEVFSIETKQWTEIAPSPERFGHLYRHVGVIDSRIYFLCTEDSEVFYASYDTEKNEFSEIVNVGPGLCKVSVLAVGYPYQ